VHSRTCNVLILMCHGGVGSILVMIDVLDCYILYMSLLLFVYCILYTCFGGSPAEEADKIEKKLKKIPYVGPCGSRRGWSGQPCDSYVHWGTDEHKANVAPGLTRAYVAYVCRSGGTNKCKGLRFVDSA
jgi:hypothetical protein